MPVGPQVGDPLEGRSECHVAPAEWRLLGWLERERIEYDTYAETQLHFGDLVLDDYKILIISAHPEYAPPNDSLLDPLHLSDPQTNINFW